MSTSIDNRIVEMKFDNENFEKNVKESQQTLEKFKEALNLTSSAENFNKNMNQAIEGIDFSSMADSLEFLANRFSTLGIIGITVIQDIANAALSAAKNMVSYITNAVVQGGRTRAQNIEEAKFMLAGLDIQWKDIFQDINYGVEDTAYGLDVAAKAAGQLAASGVEYAGIWANDGKSPMSKALLGISGLAAMTNSSYEEIANIFTRVAGNGRLMGQDLTMIGQRGINAAKELEKFFNGVNDGSIQASERVTSSIKTLTGGLQITEAEIRDFTSKGKINFEVFSEAMWEAFGEHSKEANNTLNGILANIRAALAKIGADFWTPLIMNNGSLVEMLKSVRLRINDIKAAIRDTLGFVADENGNEYLVKWKELIDKVFTSLKEKFDSVDIQKLTENVKTIINSVINFGKTLINIFNSIKLLISPIINAFKEVFKVEGINTFLNLIEKISESLMKISSKIKLMIQWKDITENIFTIAKAVFSVIELGWNILKGAASVVGGIVKSLIPAVDSTFQLGAGIASIVAKITDFINKSGVIQTTFENIRLVVTGVVSGIVTFVNSIIEGFTKVVLHTDNVKDSFAKFSEILLNIGGTINAFLKTHLPKLQDGLSGVGGVIGKVLGFAVSLFDKLKNFVHTIAPGIEYAIEKIAYLVDRLAGTLVNVFNNLDTDKVFSIINKGIFAKILSGMAGFISQLETNMTAIQAVLNRFTFFVQEAFGANGTKAAMIKNFAISIGILAAALFVLSSVDPEKLVAPLAALMTLMQEFVVIVNELVGVTSINASSISGSITYFFQSLANGITLSRKSTAFIKLAAAIFIIAGALRMLAELDVEQLAVGIMGISVIMAELAIVANYLSKSEKTMIKGAAALLPFSAAVLILAKAVENLSTLSWDGLAKGLSGLIVIVGTLTGMAIALEKTESSLTKFGLSLIPFAAGVLILSEAVEKLSYLSWEELARGLAGFAAILGVVTGMAITLEKTSSSLTKLGLSLVPFAAGVLILSEAIEKLADLSWDELARGLTTFAVAMGIVAGLAITLEKTSSSLMVVGLAMIPFATGVVILADAIKKLAGLSWNDLLKGLTGLASALGVVAGLALLMNATQSSLAATGAGLLVFAAALAILVPELKALGNMSWTNIAKAITALAAALTVLGVAGALLSGMAGEMALLGLAIAAFGTGLALAGAGVLAFATGLTALGVALGSLGKGISTLIKEIIGLIPAIIDGLGAIVESFANFLTTAFSSIVKVFVSFISAVCDAILEAAPRILTTIIQLLDSLIEYLPQIIDKVITMVVKIIEGVADRMPDLVGAIAKLVGAFFDAVMDLFKDVTLTELVNALKDLSSMALYLAIVGEMGAAAIKGLAILAILIAGLGAITVGLGALVKAIPDLEELLTRGIPILSKIGYAIGEFVGNLVGGFLGGLSNALPEIADNLSSFMKKLQPFIDGARSVDSAVAKGALYLAETILVLTATSIINGIAKFLGGDSDFGKLGEQLVPFGEAMAEFAKEVKGIDPEVVEAAANAGKMIAEMAASLPNEGGLLGKIVGENSMGLIGPQLKDFGQALKDFSDVITEGGGINTDAVQAAANAGKTIAEMAKELPNEGGLLAKIVGENSLGVIGPQLADFGKSLKDFSDAIVGFDPEAVTAAANAGKALAEMADTVPNSGGLVAFFAGENDLGEFGEKLPQFGEDLVEFSKSVSGFQTEGVAASTQAGKMLTEMAATIPNTGGLVSWFTGNNDLDDFGEKLASFGTNLVEYSESVSGFKEEGVTASILAGKALVEMAATIPNTGGLVSFFAGNNGLTDFGNALPEFGKSIKSYANNVSGIVTDGLDASIETVTALADVAATIPKSGGILSVFGGDNDFGKFGSSLAQFATSLVTYSQEVAKVNYSAVDTATSEITKLIEMFKNLKAVDPSIASNFKMALEQIASAGIKGFTNTFSKATTDVQNVSKEIKEAVLRGIGNIDSDLNKKGEGASKSFINGFEKNKSAAKSSASSLADSVTEGLKKSEKNARDTATNAINEFIKAFSSQRQTVYNEGVIIGQKAADGIKSISFYNIGSNAMQGLINGMNSMYWSVYNSAYTIASAAAYAAKLALKERSPSRIMMEIGEYAGEGLALGIDESEVAVKSASANVSKTAIQTVAKTIATMQDIIDDNLEIQPVITPVLDSSQIQNGISSLNGMTGSGIFVGSTGLGIAGGLSYTSPYFSYDRYNDSKVVEAINNLELRLDDAVTRMENLQIVLDTGTLVGETAPMMNDEFGDLDSLVKRGVM